MTKQALSSRVVDSEETGRHFTSTELSALFEFSPGECAEDIEDAAALQTQTQTVAEVCAVSSQDADSESESSKKKRTTAAQAVVLPTEAGAAHSKTDQKADATSKATDSDPEHDKSEEVDLKSMKLWRGVGLPPADQLLARVLSRMLPKWVVGYHEADSLIESEAQLSEEEVQAAWAEYRAHEDRMKTDQNMTQKSDSAGGRGADQTQTQTNADLVEIQNLTARLQVIERMRVESVSLGVPLNATYAREEEQIRVRLALLAAKVKVNTIKVSLSIPAGLGPDRQVQFQYNGKLYNIGVPPGVMPGQLLEVQLPA